MAAVKKDVVLVAEIQYENSQFLRLRTYGGNVVRELSVPRSRIKGTKQIRTKKTVRPFRITIQGSWARENGLTEDVR